MKRLTGQLKKGQKFERICFKYYYIQNKISLKQIKDFKHLQS